jgi:hypothetical protein
MKQDQRLAIRPGQMAAAAEEKTVVFVGKSSGTGSPPGYATAGGPV